MIWLPLNNIPILVSNMKLGIFVLALSLLVGAASADENNFFDTMKKVEMPPARIYTISPAQIKAGIVTEIVVQGENFRPVNSWSIPGVKILKERYVDSNTMILTVLASRGAALRAMSLPQSAPVSVEVLAADTLLSDDFDDGDLTGWNVSKGAWAATSGEAQVTATKKGQLSPVLENTDNITLDWDMTLVSGKFAGLLFHSRDSRNYRLLVLDGSKGVIRLYDCFDGKYDSKLKFPFSGGVNAQHHYTLTIADNVVSLSIDASPVFTQNLGFIYSGQIALYAKKATSLFDNIVVTHDPAANVIPIASFTASAAGGTASLNASGSIDPDGSIAQYQWDFGDGSTGSGVNISHPYTQSGTYTITLSITDNSGARTKTFQKLTVNIGPTDVQAIKDVVSHFFVLLADLEFRSPQEICQDFSRNPACPAYDKQVADLAEGQPNVQWFDVEFLSDVLMTFQSPTVAYPVKIRNKLKAIYFGDPNLYYTDGWHTYKVVKEADGKWHQCSYTFQLISTNEK